jgi:hypothetical protein
MLLTELNITVVNVPFLTLATCCNSAVSPSKLFATCSDTAQYHHHKYSLHVVKVQDHCHNCSLHVVTVKYHHRNCLPRSETAVSPSTLLATCSDKLCSITITTVRYMFWHSAVSPSQLFVTCSDTLQYQHHNCSLHVLTQCSITITTVRYMFW